VLADRDLFMLVTDVRSHAAVNLDAARIFKCNSDGRHANRSTALRCVSRRRRVFAADSFHVTRTEITAKSNQPPDQANRSNATRAPLQRQRQRQRKPLARPPRHAVYCAFTPSTSESDTTSGLAAWFDCDYNNHLHRHHHFIYYAPPPIGGGIKRCFCLTSDVCLSGVCLSRTSGLSREQRGLGRPKLTQR